MDLIILGRWNKRCVRVKRIGWLGEHTHEFSQREIKYQETAKEICCFKNTDKTSEGRVKKMENDFFWERCLE